MRSMDLADEFHREMDSIYCVAASLGYRPSYFLQIVQQYGGVETAKRLLNVSEAQSGLTKLWELGRLDISMEALVVQEQWKPLFSDAERQVARERLIALDYDPAPGQ